MKARLITVAAIITTLVIFGALAYIDHLRNQRDDALAYNTQLRLEAEGYKQALTVKPKEVIKLVPTLVTKEVVRLVREKKIEPVMAATVEAKKDVEVTLPPSIEPAEPIPLHLAFHANLLVTRIKFGIATEYKADARGSIAVADEEPLPFSFNDDEVHFEVRVSDEISKALVDHEKEGGWLKRHTGLQCPGVGLAIDPFDGAVRGAVTCSYGFVFF